MRLFGALVLICMLFFEEIEASSLRHVRTKGKKKDQGVSSVDHLATSRADRISAWTHNQHSLGQKVLDLHEHSHRQSSDELLRRQIAGLALFRQYCGPPLIANHLGWTPHGNACPHSPPQSYDQFGVPGHNEYVAPSLLPHSEDHSGGSGTHGYADSSFFPHSWVNYGGHGSGPGK